MCSCFKAFFGTKSGKSRNDAATVGPPEEQRLSEAEKVEAARVLQSLPGMSMDDIVEAAGGGEYSFVATKVDSLQARAFSEPLVREAGSTRARAKLEEGGVGFSSSKADWPGPNSEKCFVLQAEGLPSIYAVFSGVGQRGYDVSQFVCDCLVKLLLADPRLKSGNEGEQKDMLTRCFKMMHMLLVQASDMREINSELSGCSATVVLHHHKERKLTIGHVGLSSVIIVKGESKEAVLANTIHRASVADEKRRIESTGAGVESDTVGNQRIYAKDERWPGMTVSRTFGCLRARVCGVISEPEIVFPKLSGDDTFLLLASNGVMCNYDDDVPAIARIPKGDKAMVRKDCDELCFPHEAYNMDRTVILAHL